MKNIIIKYLSLEAIENTITCLYYKIDGVIFLGRKEIIDEEYHNTTTFLKKYCNTDVLDYITIDNKSIENIVEIIHSFNRENSRYFLDLTGSEGLFTAAALACSKEYPLHIYDVKENKVANISTKYISNYSINDIEKRNIKLDIPAYISMIGGRVIEQTNNFKYDINELVIELRNKHKDTWNYFSNVINKSDGSFDSLVITCNNLKPMLSPRISEQDVENILLDCKDMSLIHSLKLEKINGKLHAFRFTFKNDSIKHLVKNTGSVFEQIVYLDNRKDSSDCMIGVNLDWDGQIKELGQPDVRNEIDVIRLDDHIITFISCKNREIRKEDIYELESIARNFAGNYVQMVIATPCEVKKEVKLRANELGVKISYYI